MKKCVIFLVICSLLSLAACAKKEPLQGQQAGSYPLDTDVELTYWSTEAVEDILGAVGYDDLPFKTYLEEETGVHIKFLQPDKTPYTFIDLMIASDKLPDIIEADWYSYTGGQVQRLIDKQVIEPLNAYFDQDAPNLRAYLSENPELDSAIRTHEGNYYMYPLIREDARMGNYIGTMVRQDVLDERGLPLPETVGQWEQALSAFQDAQLLPMTFGFHNIDQYYRTANPILPAFGLLSGFYAEDGRVKYGEYEPAFADYLRTLADWYRRGLIDPEFYNQGYEKLNPLAGEGKIGAVTGNGGRDFGRWIPELAKKNAAFHYAPVKYAAPSEGERPIGGGRPGRVFGFGAVITTQCTNKQIAARFLDFGYSHKGRMLYNFGRVGVTYTLESGSPVYTDFITNYRRYGYESMAHAIKPYTRGSAQGPFVQDWRYLEQYYQLGEQKKALEVWNDSGAQSSTLPMLAFTTQEGDELSGIIERVDAYLMEALYEIIAGGADDLQIGEFYATLREIGIRRAIEIQQAAYDRYLESGVQK